MAVEWYVRRGNEQWGPITEKEFERLQGHLVAGDLLWRNDWQEWRPYQIAPNRPETEQRAQINPEELIDELIRADLANRGIDTSARSRCQYAVVVKELMLSILHQAGARALLPSNYCAIHTIKSRPWILVLEAPGLSAVVANRLAGCMASALPRVCVGVWNASCYRDLHHPETLGPTDAS